MNDKFVPQPKSREVEGACDTCVKRLLTEDQAARMIETSIEEAVECYDSTIKHFIDEKVSELNKQLKDSFPNGDAAGHRVAHEAFIKAAIARSQLQQSVLEKTIGGIVWSLAILVAVCVWEYAKGAIRK